MTPPSATGVRTAYVRLAVRLFGPLARRGVASEPRIALALEQAHLGLMPETFLSLAWMNALAATLLAALLLTGGTALLLVGGGGAPSPAALVLVLIAPFLVGGVVYLAQAAYPSYRAGERRRLIELDLPYAVSYVAAMSSSGAVPSVIFNDLARQSIYREVGREFAWLARDMAMLGDDFVTATNRAIQRTPSLRMQEFLQGVKTTTVSGGDLKRYFTAKADQYMVENRRRQKEFLEGLGILAESYVTVVIAGPLFLLVLLSMMIIVGRSPESTELFLYFLVFLLLPASHLGFTWITKNLTPEG